MHAFNVCRSLKSVTIPNSVTSIGQGAFGGNDYPVVVSFIENPFAIFGINGGDTFTKNTFNNATLYVPKGTINKYKATRGWKDFKFIEEGEGITNDISHILAKAIMIHSEDGILTIQGVDEGSTVAVYSVSGQLVGSTKANGNQVSLATNIKKGEVAIIKIGEKSVKVVMQ